MNVIAVNKRSPSGFSIYTLGGKKVADIKNGEHYPVYLDQPGVGKKVVVGTVSEDAAAYGTHVSPYLPQPDTWQWVSPEGLSYGDLYQRGPEFLPVRLDVDCRIVFKDGRMAIDPYRNYSDDVTSAVEDEVSHDYDDDDRYDDDPNLIWCEDCGEFHEE